MTSLYSRTLTNERPASVDAVDCDGAAADLIAWLTARAQHDQLKYMLAHADDGVIWGRLDGGTLLTSHDAAPDTSPALRFATVQQVRLFGETGEVLLWKDPGELRARRLADDTETPGFVQSYDESQVLWGSESEPRPHGFRLWREGAQGLQHALPVADAARDRPPRLRIRHYLSPTGHARVVVSRLVGFETP